MKSVCLALVLMAAAVSAKNSYECTHDFNFITGAQYSQIDLTDGCSSNGVCDANPVYNLENQKNCPKMAVKYCQAQCDAKPSCTGFFFQKHQNGHEICGFYAGSETMHAADAQWAKHGHRDVSQICEVVDTPIATPAPQPATIKQVQITMQLSTAVQEFAEGNPAFDIAFRTTIAGLAGHVCADFSMCSPNDVLVTHLATSSITFQLHVADGHLAAGVAANIQAHVEGGHFGASLVANGLTDAAAIEKMVFGEVKEVEEVTESPVSMTNGANDEQPATYHHYLKACTKRRAVFGSVIFAVIALAVMAMMVVRRRRQQAMHTQLAEFPTQEAQEAVTVVVETPEYAKVAIDETTKVDLEETSKDQA